MGGVSHGSADPALSLPFGGVAPLGLGTHHLERLSSYVIRVGNVFALPAPELLRHALRQVSGVRERKRLLVRGALNGAGPSVAVAAAGLAAFTGMADGERMSCTGLVQRLRLHDRGLVSATRRWCPLCWARDAEPYDRKLWWLGLVDACPVHACLLETRRATCGQLQPSLTRGVRLHHCSHCGHDLMEGSAPVVVGSGLGAARRLWYARQASDLVRVDEVIVPTGSDEARSIVAACRALSERASERGLHGVSVSLRRIGAVLVRSRAGGARVASRWHSKSDTYVTRVTRGIEMSEHDSTKRLPGRILGEIYRIQNATEGMEPVAGPGRIYGLLNGFDEAIDEELEYAKGISNDKLGAVTDVLNPIFDDPERLNQFQGFYDVEKELQARGVSRTEAMKILKYLWNNESFTELIDKMDSSRSPAECRTFELRTYEK